ncbi:helix-turn-helix domain-containing protein [Halomicrococcus sp. SG-WS-1]|uniref:helix-turn-helix domain-containing protein n=1 Tax=Halomicrococcus sp. SG-WS-1 TaxID=3439057 RepID=UPI003F7ACD88
MSVIVELTISSQEFLLGTALGIPGRTRVELERVVPASPDVLPFFWVISDDPSAFEEFERHVSETEEVNDLVALDRLDDRVLYRAKWGKAVESLVQGIAESGATILEARGNDEWYFRLRFADHGDLSVFDTYCDEHGLDYRLDRVSTESATHDESYEFDLTDEQREALVMAVERGYFDVPREVTLDELADELDITQQAMSERLRRGEQTVMRTALSEADGDTLA